MARATGGRRADAQRNYDRLVAAANDVIAEQGAGASLEEIARRAGVGSATLHRHFRTRPALLEAVFSERVDRLCAMAHDLLAEPDAGRALVSWLRAVVAHAAATRGMGAALMAVATGAEVGSSAHDAIRSAGEALLARAQRERVARLDVAITDLLQLVHAIANASENGPEPAEQAERLLAIVVNGVCPGTGDGPATLAP